MPQLPALAFVGQPSQSDPNAFGRGLQIADFFNSRELGPQALGGDSQAFARLAGINPQAAESIQNIRSSQAKTQAGAQEQKIAGLQLTKRMLDAVAGADPQLQPSLYNAARQRLEQAGVDVSTAPEQFDPAFVEQQRTLLQAFETQGGFEAGSTIGKLSEDLRNGVITQDQFDAAFTKATTTKPLVEVNVGQDGIDYGQPPKGMAWARNPDGSVATQQNDQGFSAPVAIPIAGGDVEKERAEAGEAAVQKEAQQTRTTDIVTQDIDRVVSILDSEDAFPVTGLFSLAQSIPGTTANDAARLVDTIKANVGFDKLQALRDASPTGGALGQVSERENILLQSTIGNLELSQNKNQLKFNLQRVKEIYNEIVHGISSGGQTGFKVEGGQLVPAQ